MQRILVFILFLLMLPFVFVYNILKGIGKLVTYPFRRLNNRVQDWSDLKLYERYGHRKFFFYSNINSRFVESNILPLIKGKFEVFFIDKNELDTWNEDIVLKSLIKNHFNKSKFPYLFRGFHQHLSHYHVAAPEDGRTPSESVAALTLSFQTGFYRMIEDRIMKTFSPHHSVLNYSVNSDSFLTA